MTLYLHQNPDSPMTSCCPRYWWY